MRRYPKTTVYFINLATWSAVRAYWNLPCAWNVYLIIVSCQNAFLFKVQDLYEDVSSSFQIILPSSDFPSDILKYVL